MTNYYKLYTKDKEMHRAKTVIPKAKDVRKTIAELKEVDYMVIKTIKRTTDVIVGSGHWDGQRMVTDYDRIDGDFRIIGGNVVDYNVYIKYHEGERE